MKPDFSETLISSQLFMSFDKINFLQLIGRSLADLEKGLGHAQLSAGLETECVEEMMKNCHCQSLPLSPQNRTNSSLQRADPSFISLLQKYGTLRKLSSQFRKPYIQLRERRQSWKRPITGASSSVSYSLVCLYLITTSLFTYKCIETKAPA